MRATTDTERKLWRCEVCDTTGNWSREWEYYGSIRISEDCGHIVVTCSDACRKADRAAALILAFERNHPTGGRCKISGRSTQGA